MAFNGSGTFNRIYNWVNDKANGFKIMASRMDNEFDGIATGLSQCITKDGQTTISANIPMANYKFTGLGNGTTRTDSIALGQVQDGQFTYFGTTGGTADAYTLTPSPSITAYATTQQFTAKISATNTTTTPYLQISGIANPTTTAVIKKLSATKTEIAVETSDLLINGIYHFQRNSANDAWIVLNPEKAYFNATNLTKATTTTQGVSYLNNPITIANNASDANNDIDFSAGNFNFSDGSGQAEATAVMTKRLDAPWSAGTNQGGLLNGTAVPKAVNSTYHCYKIYNPTTGAEDSAFLLGIAGTAPNPTSVLPSGFTKFERRGSILTDGSGNIRAFSQFRDYFLFSNRYLDISGNGTGTATLHTMTVPLGIIARGDFYFYGDPNAGGVYYGLITSPFQIDAIPSFSNFNAEIEATFENRTKCPLFILTNRNSQIRSRFTATTDIQFRMFTNGFFDYELKF
jgi:hypothetical protein